MIGFSFPVVPHGQARIRTQMSAAHSTDDIDRAIAAFVDGPGGRVLATGSSSGSGTCLRRRAVLLVPGLEGLAVAADVLVRAAEREQQAVLVACGWRAGA